MDKADIAIMLDWANEIGKPVRQRSARQETMKNKCGTLLLEMYPHKSQVSEDIPDTDIHNPEDDIDDQVFEYESDDNECEKSVSAKILCNDDEEMNDSESDSDTDCDTYLTLSSFNTAFETPSKNSGHITIKNSKFKN